MRSGQLRHEIRIDRDCSAEGETEPDWQILEDGVPCRVEHLKGDEVTTRSDHTEAIATHRITLRYIEGMSTKHRAIYRGRTLEVVSVADDGMDHEMWLMCRENAA